MIFNKNGFLLTFSLCPVGCSGLGKDEGMGQRVTNLCEVVAAPEGPRGGCK